MFHLDNNIAWIANDKNTWCRAWHDNRWCDDTRIFDVV